MEIRDARKQQMKHIISQPDVGAAAVDDRVSLDGLMRLTGCMLDHILGGTPYLVHWPALPSEHTEIFFSKAQSHDATWRWGVKSGLVFGSLGLISVVTNPNPHLAHFVAVHICRLPPHFSLPSSQRHSPSSRPRTRISLTRHCS